MSGQQVARVATPARSRAAGRALARREAERAFLPAALEIIESPVSPAGRIMMALIGVLVMVAVGWAWIGQIDIVATATGQVVPTGQIKQIQPLEIAVVKQVMVRGGDHVNMGQVLVRLDPTKDRADRDRFAHDILQAKVDIARMNAVLAGDPAAFVPPEGAGTAMLRDARWQLAAQLADLHAKLGSFDEQIAAKTASQRHAEATIAKLDASLPLLEDKARIYEALRQNQFSSRVTMLDTEERLVETRHDRIATRYEAQQAAAEAAALVEQKRQAEAEFRSRVLEQLHKTATYLAEQRQEWIKAARLASLQALRAPVSGTVEQVAVHTDGGVVTPAQTLMVIVPDSSKLEVRALLPNRDAGFVHAGQKAELKVEAFTYTRYGVLHGRVRDVSRDALGSGPNPAQGPGANRQRPGASNQPSPDAAYVARIALDQTSIQTEQGKLPLQAGMTVTAEIKTGKRRVISYLLSPFMRFRHDAMTER